MNSNRITPEMLEADQTRKAFLAGAIDAMRAELRQIEDRAAAWRVHKLASLMVTHERIERRRARQEREKTNPVAFNEMAEGNS